MYVSMYVGNSKLMCIYVCVVYTRVSTNVCMYVRMYARCTLLTYNTEVHGGRRDKTLFRYISRGEAEGIPNLVAVRKEKKK